MGFQKFVDEARKVRKGLLVHHGGGCASNFAQQSRAAHDDKAPYPQCCAIHLQVLGAGDRSDFRITLDLRGFSGYHWRGNGFSYRLFCFWFYFYLFFMDKLLSQNEMIYARRRRQLCRHCFQTHLQSPMSVRCSEKMDHLHEPSVFLDLLAFMNICICILSWLPVVFIYSM